MHNPLEAEDPNQRAIVENRFYIISICCSGGKNQEILFRACNFRFAFLHTVLKFYEMSSMLSIMTPKSFSEALFLIVIFLHLKLGKVLGVPRVIK